MRPTFLVHIAVPAMLALAAAAGPARALQRVYVANIAGSTVAVLDADRRAVIDAVAVGSGPDGVAISHDGSAVYVSNFGSNTMSIVDTASDTVVATVAVGKGPVGLAASPDGTAVYVTAKNAGAVTVVDPVTHAVIDTIVLGPGQGPSDVAFTPDGARALVTNSFSNGVAVIDTSTRRVTTTIQLGNGPNRIAVSADGIRAYVTEFKTGNLAVIDLATLTVVSEPQVGGQLSGVAVSPDGRSVYVVRSTDVVRIDAASLAPSGEAFLGGAAYGAAVVPGVGAVLVANMARNEVAFAPAPLSLTGSVQPPPAVSVSGGPFALAALPRRDTPALAVSIDAPPFDFKLDPNDRVAVRISVADGTARLASWALVLHSLEGVSPDRPLANGTDPVVGTVVAMLDGADLVAGTGYALRLDAVADDATVVTRQTRLFVPDRHYAQVPLEPIRPGYYTPPFVMDAAGERFVRQNAATGQLDLYEASSGALTAIGSALPYDSATARQLSRDGRRAAISGTLAGGVGFFGILDIDNGALDVLPFGADTIDMDAEGRWLAAGNVLEPLNRYQLYDTFAGERVPIDDTNNLRDPPTLCRLLTGNGPRLSADGATAAFATGLDFGVAAAVGCSVFTFDRTAGQLHFVASLGTTQLDQPSLDDAGLTMGLVLSPDVSNGYLHARATLIDLASGAQRALPDGDTAASYDAAVTGDGSAMVISSCADLDPRVGNADRNQELFLYDLASHTAQQITDTQGGPVDCTSRDGIPYAPAVSRDGRVVAFAGRYGPAGPQRSLRNGLAFGAVRAVHIGPGNHPPTLTLPSDRRALLSEGFSFTVSATDPDADPITLFAELDDLAGLPSNAAFIPDRTQPRASFTWFDFTPDVVGEHTLRVGGFDGRGGEAVNAVRLTVCRAFVDSASPATIVAAIFDPPPPACGSADTNGDGAISAADLVALRAPGT